MASKFAWLMRRRNVLFVVTIVAALVNAKCGGHDVLTGFWDGPK